VFWKEKNEMNKFVRQIKTNFSVAIREILKSKLIKLEFYIIINICQRTRPENKELVMCVLNIKF